MNIVCDAPGCIRGLVHLAGGWANPCKVCEGLGTLSLARIGKLVGENGSTIRRLARPGKRMRPRTASRILDKLLEVLR